MRRNWAPFRVSLTGIPVVINLFSASSTLIAGSFCLSKAQAPDTCAAACEVPNPVACPPPGMADVISTPGASRFKNDAALELCQTVSTGTAPLPSPTAPTLTAVDMQAGKLRALVNPSFPAATTVGIPTDLN